MKSVFFSLLTPTKVILGGLSIAVAGTLTATSIIFTQKANADTVKLTLYAGDYGNFTNDKTYVLDVKKGSNLKEVVNTIKPTPIEGWDFKGYVNYEDQEDYVINYDDYAFAYYSEHVYEAKSFAEDNWATLANEANKGLKSLKEVYSKTAPFNEKNSEGITNWEAWGSSFVISDYTNPDEVKAKTRYTTLKGYEEAYPSKDGFPVKVIGENHDYINENYDVATLTFEFNNVLDVIDFSKGGKNYNFYYYNNGESSYSCYLRDYFNEVFYNLLPDSLKDNIRPVLKETYGFSKPMAMKPIISEDKLFPLSLKEMNAIPNASPSSNELFDEGKSYSYYLKNNYNTAKVKNYRSYPYSYYSRTAKLDRTIISYGIDNEGEVSLYYPNQSEGVSPAFCIGQDSAVNGYKTGCCLELVEGKIITKDGTSITEPGDKTPLFASDYSSNNYVANLKITHGTKFKVIGLDGKPIGFENNPISTLNSITKGSSNDVLVNNHDKDKNECEEFLIHINYDIKKGNPVIGFAATDTFFYETVDGSSKGAPFDVRFDENGNIMHYVKFSCDYGKDKSKEEYRGVAYWHFIYSNESTEETARTKYTGEHICSEDLALQYYVIEESSKVFAIAPCLHPTKKESIYTNNTNSEFAIYFSNTGNEGWEKFHLKILKTGEYPE